eukprot:TCALIF_13414-PA protein Name:"Protein of unknown function" AED:0.73 eAED:0.79 QI:0/0/0/0.33/1/1/3/0/196
MDGSPWDWQGGNVRYSTVQTDSSQDLPNDSDPISLEVTTNVTVFEGETVHLPCRVRNLGEYTVSWMRGRDMSVVSVGHVTFSSDKRYHVVHVPRPRLNAADWNLEVRLMAFEDGASPITMRPKKNTTASKQEGRRKDNNNNNNSDNQSFFLTVVKSGTQSESTCSSNFVFPHPGRQAGRQADRQTDRRTLKEREFV